MTVAENLYLIGPMGSGKSAVGRQLARRLHLDFVDADAEIESRTGVDIAYIFEREGEQGFRARERDLLDELSRRRGLVVATGGGAVLDAETRRRLRERGCVVYLRASVDQQLARTRHGTHRPLLNNADPRGTLEHLMALRAPLYEEIAEIVSNTDGRKVTTVVEDVLRQYRARGPT
jgi:shikimate kinase